MNREIDQKQQIDAEREDAIGRAFLTILENDTRSPLIAIPEHLVNGVPDEFMDFRYGTEIFEKIRDAWTLLTSFEERMMAIMRMEGNHPEQVTRLCQELVDAMRTAGYPEGHVISVLGELNKKFAGVISS